MLVLKLFLVPAFLALVSLAGKRWGPGVAGWLAGFPIVSGPILLFLALEKGPLFAAQAATLSLSAVFASVAFSLAYSWTCLHRSWPQSTALGLCAWLLAAFILRLMPLSAFIALGIALATLLAAPRFFPSIATAAAPSVLPRQELIFRMAAGAALTLAVTALSSSIGPAWSGLLAVFPILGIVLAVFSHTANGAPFVVALLKAMASGLYSFVTFCLTLTLLLPTQGILISFAAATVAAAVVHGSVKAWTLVDRQALFFRLKQTVKR